MMMTARVSTADKQFDSVPDNKIVGLSKLNAFADDKFNVVQPA